MGLGACSSPNFIAPTFSFPNLSFCRGQLSVTMSTTPPADNHSSIDFRDGSKAYSSYSDSKLLGAIVIYRLCTWQWLVRHSERIVKLAYKFLPEAFVSLVLKKTFFQHFCAGEDQDSIRPTIKHLENFGVGSILDYAAEADLNDVPVIMMEPSKKASHHHKATVSARTYSYRGELNCDSHLRTFLKCVTAVHNVSPEGFAAIKLTALGQPALLERMSNALVEIRRFFVRLDTHKTGFLDWDVFREGWLSNFRVQNEAQVREAFERFDTNRSGKVSYIEFSRSLGVEDLGALIAECKEQGPLAQAALTGEEIQLIIQMRDRLTQICALAQELNVRLMIDAEQTYFQPAIDNMVLDMQRKYNRDFPTVFTTYQCYLKDAVDRVKLDLDRAKQEGFWFGAKLVRGAYMVQERDRAKRLGQESPICDTIQDTHASFHAALEECVSRLHRVNIMVASHNEQSMLRAVELIKAHTQHADHATCGVYFGQLLGMADNLTFSLGQAGFKSYKYVPFGAVREVMPYLLRRAQENSTIMGRVGEEQKMLKNELMRRWIGMEFPFKD